MSGIVVTCSIITQIATGQIAATMKWPDGPEARAACEQQSREMNHKAEGLCFTYRATCEPFATCPALGDPTPETPCASSPPEH